jgi:zinc transporter ZupT
VDHHLVAAVSISGVSLDVLGGLYLAYDLLGGPHGPLRVLTRAVTYSLVFGIGYGLGLGTFFGIAAGLTTGCTVSLELNRMAGRNDHYAFRWEVFFSAIRAAGFGIALWRMVGGPFAMTFAALATAGQAVAYFRGMRPSVDYSRSRKPRMTRKLFHGTMIRTIGYLAASLISSTLAHRVEHPFLFALRVGIVTGIVTAIGITVNPFIEYWADHLPERRLGVFGIWMVLCGFAMQSVQYWVALLEIPLK